MVNKLVSKLFGQKKEEPVEPPKEDPLQPYRDKRDLAKIRLDYSETKIRQMRATELLSTIELIKSYTPKELGVAIVETLEAYEGETRLRSKSIVVEYSARKRSFESLDSFIEAKEKEQENAIDQLSEENHCD